MNRKGFTLIELLAVLTILGVISTIVVTAAVKYMNISRSKSFVMMSQSIYHATEQCMLTRGIDECNTTEKLIDNAYLENLKNPVSSSPDCSGSINIIDDSVDGRVAYKYGVTLTCDRLYKDAYILWPNTKHITKIVKEISRR